MWFMKPCPGCGDPEAAQVGCTKTDGRGPKGHFFTSVNFYWCKKCGQEFIGIEEDEECYKLYIRKTK